MNQNTAASDWMILNPAMVSRKASGVVSVLAYRDGKENYVTERHYLDAEARGLISIIEIGGNELADMFGRIRITYTINKD